MPYGAIMTFPSKDVPANKYIREQEHDADGLVIWYQAIHARLNWGMQEFSVVYETRN